MAQRLIGLGAAVLVSAMVGPLRAAAQESPASGRPLAIEDYYRIQTVGGAAISPDGRWVTYTVSSRVEESNGTDSQTWLVATDGQRQPWRVMHYGRDVSGGRWTDEGRLEYMAERRRWTIDPATPSARPIPGPAIPESRASGGRGGRGGASGAPAGGIPSPDGRWAVRLEEKRAARAEPTYASDFERRHLAGDRFRGAIFDWKDFQRDGAPFPAPDPTAQPAQQVVLQPRDKDEARVLLDADMRPSGLAWHPDGRLLAFTADPEWRNELKYSRADLYTLAIDGALTRLTDDPYVYSDAGFSPDGRYLSYVQSFGTDMIIDRTLNHGGPRDLYVRPVAGGEPVNLTAGWDLEPGPAHWSPDSRFLYFSAGIGGEVHLFRVAAGGGQVEQVTKGPRRVNGITFDKAMTRIAYLVGVHERPADVYVANIDGSGERRLTDVHHSLAAEVAFGRAERLEWASSDGTRIEGWLLHPHGYDQGKGPYPLIVTSHGGPHSATGYSFDFKDQYFAANGYFVLDTNFRGSTGYGDAFKWATWGAWGTEDGEDVVSGIDYVLKRYPIDPARVGHTGHSYGGFLTNWLITQYPDRFAAAVSGAGISNWISDYGTADIYRTKETEFFGPPWEEKAREIMIRQSPLTHAGRVKTPTLFVHGEVDQRVPYEEAEQMYFALTRRGVPAKMIQYAGQPHGIGGHWNNVHRMLSELQWWDKYLKAPRTSSSEQENGRR